MRIDIKVESIGYFYFVIRRIILDIIIFLLFYFGLVENLNKIVKEVGLVEIIEVILERECF